MRYFLILVFITFSLVACSDKTQTTTSQNSSASNSNDYLDVNIYYGKEKGIWVYNPKTQLKSKILDNAFGPLLSPDKTKFAYWVPHKGIKTEFGDDLTSYHIYDIKTGESNILLKEALTYPNFDFEQWSPDSRYLIFDSGSSPTRGKYIIDTNTKKVVAEFTAVGGDFLWLNNNEIIFDDEEDVVVGKYVKTISKIASINVTNGQHNIVFSGNDYDTKYYFLAIVGDKILIGSHDKYDKKQYFLVNKDGSGKIQVEEGKYETYEEKNRKDIDELDTKAKSLLPEPYNKYQYCWVERGINSWILVQVTQDVRNSNSDIFIVDTNNPKSLRKIDNGDSATW